MEYSDAAAVELYRIRVLLTRFVVFVALFLLLVVAPVLCWLSWVGYAWTLMPSESSLITVGDIQPNAEAMRFAKDVPVKAQQLQEALTNLAEKAFKR